MEQFHLSMLQNIVLIALMTHRDIAVVAAEEDLIALGHDAASGLMRALGRGLSSAVANGFDLGNGVGQLESRMLPGNSFVWKSVRRPKHRTGRSSRSTSSRS